MGPDQDLGEDGDQGVALATCTIATPKKHTVDSRPLTSTEERVLNLVAQCKTNREIAKDLGISYATVKRHIENILRKLSLRNRVEAAVYALSVQRCSKEHDNDCPLVVWWKKSREEY